MGGFVIIIDVMTFCMGNIAIERWKYMDRVLNLQMSLFGTFINIRLETEIVIKLLTALKEDGFVPGTVDIASVDLPTGKMVVDSRMQMISPNKTWTIAFLPDRIDVCYTHQQETKIYKCIDELLPYAKELVEKVFAVFSSTLGNRIALNCRFALENMTEDDLKQFCGRFTKPLLAYSSDSYAEWSVRFNARKKIKISENIEEECNCITEMLQVENMINGENRNNSHNIVLTMDINTMAMNLVQRFKYDDLIYFADNAASFVSVVTNEIERGQL